MEAPSRQDVLAESPHNSSVAGVLKQGSFGVSAGVPAGPSPAILKKVKKVLDTRIEAPELAVALKELSQFYGPNTLENRRNLRTSIERRSVQVSQNLVDCFSDVMASLDKVERDVNLLAQCTQRMQQRVKAAHATTSQVVRITEQLQRKETESVAHQELVSQFLAHFRLSAQQKQALCSDPISEEFLGVLARVGEVQAQCRQLLRVHHKTALMDLVDETAALQETGYDRLYRWMQSECSQLEGDVPEVPALVRHGINALRGRGALYKVCLEDLGSSRRQAMFKKFITALTRGGPGGVPRPIEMHAHEPLRYVGDMLAWLHQALATERELLGSLFADAGGEHGEGGGRGSAEPRDNAGITDQDRVLSSVFEGVTSTVQARVESVLQAQTSPVVTFKLGNLLLFYLHTVGAMLPEGAPLTATLQMCHKQAGRLFMEFLNVTAQRLYKQPPPAPQSLAPHPEVSAIIEELSEIMSSFDSSLVPARVRENYFRPVVDEAVEPLLAGCTLAANSIAPAEGSVYMANCILALQGVLQRFDFCAWRVPKIQAQLQQALDQAVHEQVEALLRQVNLDEKVYAVRAHAQGEGRCLSDMAGMDPLALSVGLKQFYAAVLSNSLDFKFVDKLGSHLLRQKCRELVTHGLAKCYTELVEAVLDKDSGYKEPSAMLLHSAAQIESLLKANA